MLPPRPDWNDLREEITVSGLWLDAGHWCLIAIQFLLLAVFVSSKRIWTLGRDWLACLLSGDYL